MPTLTFEQLHARVAAHWRAEAARNRPEAVARRCVYELASLLAELGPDDRAAVLDVLRDELADAACLSGPKVGRDGGCGFTV